MKRTYRIDLPLDESEVVDCVAIRLSNTGDLLIWDDDFIKIAIAAGRWRRFELLEAK